MLNHKIENLNRLKTTKDTDVVIRKLSTNVSVLYIYGIFPATVCLGVFIREEKRNQLYQLASKRLKVSVRDQLGRSVPTWSRY